MKIYVARYEWGTGDGKYSVALYSNFKISENNPHDYFHEFTPAEWRRLGCRVPKRKETLHVELSATELPPKKAAKKK